MRSYNRSICLRLKKKKRLEYFTWEGGQTCESEKGISSENVTEDVPGSEALPLWRGSGGRSGPPETNSSEMHSEPLKEAVLSHYSCKRFITEVEKLKKRKKS